MISARKKSKPITMLGVLVVLWGVFLLIEPRFITAENIRNLLRQASIIAIAAYAQTFVVITGGTDLSTGANAALTTMVTALVAKSSGVAAGFGVGLLTGTILGFINGVLVAYLKVPPFIATLGMFIYGRSLAWYVGGGLPIEMMPDGFQTIGAGYFLGIPIPVIIAVVLIIPIHLILSRSIFGRSLYALGGNETAARSSGINVKFYRMFAFVMSGFLGGLAGVVLASRANSGQPGIFPNLEFTAIAAVAIGGTTLGGGDGNVFKALIGTLIMSTINNGLNLANVSSNYQQVALGVIVLISLIINNIQSAQYKFVSKKKLFINTK